MGELILNKLTDLQRTRISSENARIIDQIIATHIYEGMDPTTEEVERLVVIAERDLPLEKELELLYEYIEKKFLQD